MANKPTKEELEEKINEALEADPDAPEEENEPDNVEEVQSEVDEQPEEEVEESGEETDELEEQAEPSKELYKKKFSASARENQRINAKNRILNQALIEADEIPEPTEEEMKKQYGEDWDLMSDVDKRLIIETEITKRWRTKLKEASNQATKIEKWEESVTEFIQDPKTLSDNPDLEGKEAAFVEFATQEGNNNVPFNLLVGSFLYNQSTQKINHKGKMFERGSGGPNEKPKQNDGTVSLEEAMKIKKTNYAKYKELLMAKKIRFDI